MDALLEKLREAKLVFITLNLYRVLLDFIIGFLATAIMFQMIGVRLYFALIPAALYMAYKILTEYK